MINLGKEIKDMLSIHKYALDDVAYVVVYDNVDDKPHFVDPESFMSYADRVEYEAGYGFGMGRIHDRLKVVMKDGCWFDRDDSECHEHFDFHRVPQKVVVVEDYNPALCPLISYCMSDPIYIDGTPLYSEEAYPNW